MGTSLYDALARRYDHRTARRTAILAAVLRSEFGGMTGLRAVDVGVGTGALWRQLRLDRRGWSLVALDRSIAMLSQASRWPGNTMRLVGDAEGLPLRSATFDVAMLTFSIKYFLSSSALAGIKSLITYPGRIIVADYSMRSIARLAGLGLDLYRLHPRREAEAIDATLFVDDKAIKQLLVNVGFIEKRWISADLEMIRDAESAADFVLQSPMVVPWLSALSRRQVSGLRNELLRRAVPILRQGPITPQMFVATMERNRGGA